MKRTVYFFLALCLLASCKQAPKPTEQKRPLAKLEQLYRIRPDSVIPFFDLSEDSLTEFPDLSRYVIRSLDLSHNLIDTFVAERLPLGIEKLDLSHNCFRDTLEIGLKQNEKNEPFLYIEIPTLIDLDFSHNSLRYLIVYGSLLRRLDVSYNDSLSFFGVDNQLQYLDVSYDNNLRRLAISPQKIDTVIQEGLEKELEGGPPALRSVSIMTNPKIIDECEDTAETVRSASDSLAPECIIRGDSVE